MCVSVLLLAQLLAPAAAGCMASLKCGSKGASCDKYDMTSGDPIGCPDGSPFDAEYNPAVEDCSCIDGGGEVPADEGGQCSDFDNTGFPWCFVDHAKCAFWTWSSYRNMAWKGCGEHDSLEANSGQCGCIHKSADSSRDGVNCKADNQEYIWCYVPEMCPGSQSSYDNPSYSWSFCSGLGDKKALENGGNCDCENTCHDGGDTSFLWCKVGWKCPGSIYADDVGWYWKNCDSDPAKAIWNTCECAYESGFSGSDFLCGEDGDGIWCYTTPDCPGRIASTTAGKFWNFCEKIGDNKAIGGLELFAAEPAEPAEPEETGAAEQGDPCTEEGGPSSDCLTCECTSNDGGWDGTYSNCAVGPCCSNYCVKCSADGTYVGHSCPEAGSSATAATTENGTGNGSGTNVNSALKACSFCTPLFAGLISAGMIHL